MKIEIDKTNGNYIISDYTNGDKLGKYTALGFYDLMVDFLSKSEFKRFAHNEGLGIYNISDKKLHILKNGFLKSVK